MDEAKFRAAIAADLRVFAKRVDKLALADRRDPEKPVHEKMTLASDMRAKANALVREMAPPEGGRALADVVFGPSGRVTKVERARVMPEAAKARRPGRIGLALAA